MIRLVSNRFFAGRRDWARRIESRQAAIVSSAVGSAASRPSCVAQRGQVADLRERDETVIGRVVRRHAWKR